MRLAQLKSGKRLRSVPYFVAFLMGNVLLCECAAKEPKKKKNPVSTISKARYVMAKDVFGFEDRAYFDNPMGKLESIRDSLEESHSNAVLAGGPGWVSLDKEKKLPFVALRVTESPIAHARPFKEYAVVATWDASSERLYGAMFVEQKFIKIKRDPSIVPPPGKYSDGGALDLFARRVVPVTEGDFYNTVIILDSKSNRVRTQVGKSGLETDAVGFEAFLEGKRSKAEAGSSVESDLIPKAVSSGSTLMANSIRLSIEPSKAENNTEHESTLHFEYSLLRRKSPKSASNPADSNRINPVHFGLLATGTRTPDPLLWRVAVSNQSESAKEDGQVRGRFSLSTNQLKGLESAQTYYFYAFSGAEMSEPAVTLFP